MNLENSTSIPKPQLVMANKISNPNFEKNKIVQLEENLLNENKTQDLLSRNNSLVTALDLLNLGITKVPMLLDPFFPAKGVVGLTGTSDCGKSLFLRQLAISTSQGDSDFLGFPLVVKHSKSLYVCTEDDAEGIAALLHKQLNGTNKELLNNLIFLFESEDLITRMEEILKVTSVDLIVLDVWSDTFRDNPNNWVDVRRNLTLIKKIADTYNCLIVILHHTVKNSEKHSPDKSKLNGSQAIEAKLRCLLELRNGEDHNEKYLYVLKANYMDNKEKSEGYVLELDGESLLFTNLGKRISKLGMESNSGKKKYDSNFWLENMNQLRKEGFSYDKALNALAERFPKEKIPSKSWFLEQNKKVDSQTEPKVND